MIISGELQDNSIVTCDYDAAVGALSYASEAKPLPAGGATPRAGKRPINLDPMGYMVGGRGGWGGQAWRQRWEGHCGGPAVFGVRSGPSSSKCVPNPPLCLKHPTRRSRTPPTTMRTSPWPDRPTPALLPSPMPLCSRCSLSPLARLLCFSIDIPPAVRCCLTASRFSQSQPHTLQEKVWSLMIVFT